jgi:hypothetical protein
VRLIGRNHNLISQFLKGLKVERTGKKQRKKMYSINRFTKEYEYDKSTVKGREGILS